MDIDLLELSRTSFVGAYLLIGLAFILYELFENERPELLQTQKWPDLPWYIALAGLILFYGCGVIIENVSDDFVGENGLVKYEERIKVCALCEDCNVLNPLIYMSTYKSNDLATDLAEWLDQSVPNSTSLPDSMKRATLQYKYKDIRSFVTKIKESSDSYSDVKEDIRNMYYLAKNRVYKEATYFQEMTEIKARSDFSRSCLLVSFLLFVVTVLLSLHHGYQVRSGGSFKSYQAYLMSKSYLKSPKAWKVATFLVLLVVAYFLSFWAFYAEEIQFNRRAFGYFLALWL